MIRNPITNSIIDHFDKDIIKCRISVVQRKYKNTPMRGGNSAVALIVIAFEEIVKAKLSPRQENSLNSAGQRTYIYLNYMRH